MRKGKLYIGTSGWQYKHWKGKFYPAHLKPEEQFRFYCQHFDTVEVNNSFYKLPSAKTFDDWHNKAPAKFLFAVKASRFITHMKKLKGGKSTFSKFFSHANGLGKKLGPVLFQLPPRWKQNLDRMKDFLLKLPQGIRYTFEFRDHSWYTCELYSLLRKHKCAFCIYELAQHQSPVEVTSDFVYIRLHGPADKYQGKYTDSQLKGWAYKCGAWQDEGKDVYIYFDNDQEAYAPHNALRLKDFCSKRVAE